MKKKNEFDTLAEAQDYIDWREITFGTMNGLLANDTNPFDPTVPEFKPMDTIFEERAVAGDVKAKVFLRHVAAGGKTSYDPLDPTGAANRTYIAKLKTELPDEPAIPLFEALCISIAGYKPYAEMEQEEFDLTWVDIEQPVLINTINKGVNIDVDITDGATDVTFEVIVSTSRDGQTYSTSIGTWQFSNYSHAHVNYLIENNRRLGRFNQFKIKPNKPCQFTATASIA